MTLAGRIGRLAIAAVLGLGIGTIPARGVRADTFVFDRDYTNVTFSWNHLGLSRQSARILDVEGTLEFDPERPEEARLDVTLKVSSISSGVPAFDRLLKSADYFDGGRFPTVTFTSRQITRADERSGEVTGDLTIAGVTNPVTLNVAWNFLGEHPLASLNPNYKDKIIAGFSAQTRIQRSAWGIKRGIPIASDEIFISVETEMTKK